MTETNEKKENLLLNIALNIAIPTIILVKFSGEDQLGVKLGLIVALSFPIAYGIYDFFRAKKVNPFSVLGVVSVLLTGGMSLLEVELKYFAIKEATIPAILGLATIISLKTPYPLIGKLIFNDKLIQMDKVKKALEENNGERAFEKILINATYMIAGSFFLSATLNYILAKVILVSQPGTEAFNAELGKMTALSYPVITIPALIILLGALFYLFRSITKLTQLKFEEIMIDPDEHKSEHSGKSQEQD